MTRISELTLPWRWVRTAASFAALIPLVFGTGCVPSGKIAPKQPSAIIDELQGPRVERFEDGRTGFVLREVAKLDAAARRDFERGVEALGDEDFENALEHFDRVIELSPEVSAPYINIALAYRGIDRPELAEEHLQRALELVPGHPLASHEYGLLLRRAGRFAEARDIYQQSLGIVPEYSPLRRNLGILCDLYLNDLECALEQYELYRASQPEDEQVKLWLADLRRRLGR